MNKHPVLFGDYVYFAKGVAVTVKMTSDLGDKDPMQLERKLL